MTNLTCIALHPICIPRETSLIAPYVNYSLSWLVSFTATTTLIQNKKSCLEIVVDEIDEID